MFVFPPVLSPGDAVAVLAPASPFEDGAQKLAVSLAALRALELVPQVFDSARAVRGYLAGTDEARARDVNRAFGDTAIRAVFCLRGGYGAMRILDLLDYTAIRQNPKLFVGLSDITALHLAFLARAGLCGLHAPMPFRYPALPAAPKARLQSLLFGSMAAQYGAREGICALRRTDDAEGQLVGGNLALCAALCASAYFPPTDGAILFLEEVGETLYRIDRTLMTLKLAGVFERVSGVLFGSFTECPDAARLYETIDEILPRKLPVLYGFPAGHLQANHGFFIGQKARLCARERTVELFEMPRRPR